MKNLRDIIKKELCEAIIIEITLDSLQKSFKRYGIEGTEDKIKKLYKGKTREKYLEFYYGEIKRRELK